ncbi:MAG: hypothetical protein IKJ40_04440, partial [Bacteroidales bacterium]|nr:hypothetical protein [Bacteroidales bacterium]
TKAIAKNLISPLFCISYVLKFFLVFLHFEYAKIKKNIDFTTYFAKKSPLFNITIIKILKINLCVTKDFFRQRATWTIYKKANPCV